jgi:membrane-bound lytic murein transglycosylase A
LQAAAFDDLPGWTDDAHGAALRALLRSCAAITRAPAEKQMGAGGLGILAADWREPCDSAETIPAGDTAAARSYFETWFRPFSAEGVKGRDGLFTGYFEIEIRGARERNGQFATPIYRLPGDRVSVNLGEFQSDLKGRRLVGRLEGRKLVPYHSRDAIQDGALDGRELELLWIDDPVDVFMLHVQGSGRVVLSDGSVIRVGFAGHNGHDYASIGRALIERKELEQGKADWPAIRGWIENNPDKAAALFAVNPRYVFFQALDGLPAEAGPLGAQGVPLTPERSLAVDPHYVPLGLPVWLDTVWPNEPDRPLRRLFVAQDTGGAIKGVVRGDVFWGYGAPALALAGKMRSKGRYYLLLPKAAAARLTQS